MFRGGEGDIVLQLHGAAGLSGWTPYFDAISGKHDLIVPEHPGFGKSDDPGYLKSIPALARYYLDFIEQMKLESVHLIGSSLGGWLASEIAIRDSSRLKSLTLIGPAGIRPKITEGGKSATTSPEDWLRKLYRDQSFPDRILAQALTEHQRATQIKDRNTAAKLGNGTYCNPNLEKSLTGVSLAAFIVWGDSDSMVPVAHAEIWKRALPNARVCIIPECGHLPHVEKAETTAGEISKFLRECTLATANTRNVQHGRTPVKHSG
jgi:pimeloyl-ACP methyl ester carboxylesterase